MKTKANPAIRLWATATLATGFWVASHPSAAACLEKPRIVNGGVAANIFMIAPQSEVAEYVALGFRRVACPTDFSVIRQYVKRICSGAPQGNVPALDTDVAIGRSRGDACASAQAGLTEAGG